MSEHGPSGERVRHACHVLDHFMNAEGSCFPSQRTVGGCMGVSHKLAARILGSLEESDWIEIQNVQRQFGRIGHRYFAAAPDDALRNPALSLVRIGSGNGTAQGPNPDRQWDNAGSQSGNGTRAHQEIGTGTAGIGTAEPKIGTTHGAGILLNPEKSAASPSPAAAGSAAPTENKEVERIREDLITKFGSGRKQHGAQRRSNGSL
jgi:hypothetical protein